MGYKASKSVTPALRRFAFAECIALVPMHSILRKVGKGCEYKKQIMQCYSGKVHNSV